jgi:O-antigen/teichoic acid export membrane protein
MKKTTEKIIELLKFGDKKGFFHLLTANLLIQVVAFASQLFVAGILNPEDIGRIKIILTFLSVFSVIGGMGFNASTLKLCSENKTDLEKYKLLYSGVIFTLVSTIFLYLIVLLINAFGLFSKDHLITLLIPLGLFPLISNSLFGVFTAYFQSIKKIKYLSGLTISNKLIAIIFIILFSYIWGVKGYYVAFNISFLIMLIPCVNFLLNQRKIYKSEKFELKEQFSPHWFFARKSIFANLISEFSSYLDILLINLLITDMKEIGFYSFALTLTVALRIFPGTVQQIATPYFSASTHDSKNFMQIFRHYNKQLYIVVISTLVFVVFFVPPAIHLIFNEKYNNSIIYFYLLAIGWSIRQLSQLQTGAIFGLGKIHFNAYSNLFIAIFNLITIPIAIHYWGLVGVAAISIPSNLLFALITRFYLQKAVNQIL